MIKKISDVSLVVDQGAGTTGGAVADLSRDGYSYLTANETYCLEAPTKGCKATLVYANTTTSAGATVLTATSSGVVTIGTVGHGKISFAAATTEYQVMELVGVSSVLWAVANAYPVASTAAGPATTTY
jgi:hypothetical protein